MLKTFRRSLLALLLTMLSCGLLLVDVLNRISQHSFGPRQLVSPPAAWFGHSMANPTGGKCHNQTSIIKNQKPLNTPK